MVEMLEPGLTLKPAVGNDQFDRLQRRRYLLCRDKAQAAHHHQKKNNHKNLDHGDPFQRLVQAEWRRRRCLKVLRLQARQPLITLRRWTMMFTLDLNCG